MEILPFLCFHLQNPEQYKYLLAVSGGIDSMVLLHLFSKTNLYFEVCHVNFQLREKESDEDQQFVVTICEKMKIKIHVFSVETYLYAKNNNLSTQEAAREIRYNIFQQICKEHRLDWIVTAHHLNDVTENLLYTLIKSSYHHVFETIPAVHQNILRPLINFTKKEILEYAQKNLISFREDSSNLENKYARNKIRNQVIPILKEINPNIEHFLLKKFQNQSLKENFIQKRIQKIYENSIRKIHSHVITWNYKPEYFENLEELFLFFQFLIDKIFYLKIISDEQLFNLLEHSQKGKYLIDENWYSIKEKNGLTFVHKSVLEYSDVLEVSKSGTYVWNIFTINISNEYAFPIKIRKWKSGDKFENQKVSDYFVKKQYPAWLKKIAYVIEDKYSQIVEIVKIQG